MNVSNAKQPTFVSLVGMVSLLASASAAVAATTTYDGSTTSYAGGTIDPGDTVLLNDGAAVTGDVIDNGTLQWNQTGALTISSTISGTGTLSLTNTGTLNLNGATSPANTFWAQTSAATALSRWQTARGRSVGTSTWAAAAPVPSM